MCRAAGARYEESDCGESDDAGLAGTGIWACILPPSPAALDTAVDCFDSVPLTGRNTKALLDCVNERGCASLAASRCGMNPRFSWASIFFLRKHGSERVVVVWCGVRKRKEGKR